MRDGRCSFVRRSGSGGAESVQEKAGGSIQPLESSRDYASGFRALLCGLSLSLQLSLSLCLSSRTHTQTLCLHIRTRAYFSPGICVCMQRHPRTDHHSGLHALANAQREQRGNGDAEQKEDGMLRNSCTSDGVGFHRIQSSPI